MDAKARDLMTPGRIGVDGQDDPSSALAEVSVANAQHLAR